MTSVPVDQITARARQVRPGRAMLTFVAAVLFGTGWVVAKTFAVVWLGGAWTLAALRVGFEAAHGPTRSQQLAFLHAEVERLKQENARFTG